MYFVEEDGGESYESNETEVYFGSNYTNATFFNATMFEGNFTFNATQTTSVGRDSSGDGGGGGGFYNPNCDDLWRNDTTQTCFFLELVYGFNCFGCSCCPMYN